MDIKELKKKLHALMFSKQKIKQTFLKCNKHFVLSKCMFLTLQTMSDCYSNLLGDGLLVCLFFQPSDNCVNVELFQ